MEFKYFAILVCLFLLAFLLFKEVSRANKARLIWRILASIIAVTCFVLLLVPIKYETHLKQNSNEIILLTEGANADTVATIKAEKYALPGVDLKNIKAIPIPDLLYFLKTHPNTRKLNIYGYGLKEAELKNLKGYEITFHPATNPTGIISANWQAKLKTTEQLMVQGIYQNSTNRTVKLLLKGLGSAIDSVTIEAKSNKSFSFKTQPAQTGNAVYQLIALQEKDTLSKEPVPIQVADQSPMKVLILASFPDFEYKFLKNWLYENQYPLAFRSQISKNKYTSDFLNMDSLSFNRINTSSLKKFDILIIDEEELATISPDERASIDLAVNNGMGLLIRVSDPKASTSLSGRFGRFESPTLKGKPLNLILEADNFKFNKLPLEQALFLKAGQNDQPLITDAGGKILVNSSIKGSGKILVSTLSTTYNWLLEGKKADYTTYWSELLSKSARKKNEIQSVSTAPQFPVVNQKTRIITESAQAGKVPLLKIDSVKLSPRQNIELPFQWDAIYWPQNAGWNNLQINQAVESFYIYKKTDWQAVKNQQTINATHQFLKKLKNVETKNTTTYTITEEVSMWWFFIGFLLASAFLWYESRILQTK